MWARTLSKQVVLNPQESHKQIYDAPKTKDSFKYLSKYFFEIGNQKENNDYLR